MSYKKLKDLEEDGFTIYSETDTDRNVIEHETKIVVVDTKEVLSAIDNTNRIMQAGYVSSNQQLQDAIERLVGVLATKPDDKKPESFTLDINRDARGFMTSVDVKVNR